MRKSVRKEDTGYDPNAHLYQVYLDGKELKDCFTADEELGIALVYSRDDADEFILNDDGTEIVTKRLEGKIKIKLPEAL